MAAPMRETDTHFHVGSLKIAKKGLNKKTLASIKVHLAKGGEVPSYAEGTPDKPVEAKGEFKPPAVQEDPGVKFSETAPTPPVPPADLVPQTPAADAVMAGDTAAAVATPAPAYLTPESPMAGAPAPTGPAFEPPSFLGPTWAQHFADVNGRPPTEADFRPQGILGPNEPPVAPPMLPSHEAPVGAPTGAGPVVDPTQTPAVAPVKVPQLNPYDMSGARKIYENAVLAEAAARGVQVPLIQKSLGKLAEIEGRKADVAKKAGEEITRITNEGDEQSQALFQDILSSKIDPRRYWNDKTTDQKIRGGIGMLLSGIGSGLTGQPNLAIQLIERAIDRDIDAQKATLDLKKTAFSWNLQRTQNRVQAALLTKLQGFDVAAAELERQKNQLGSDLAPSNYDIAKAELDQKRAITRDAFVNSAMQQYSMKVNMDFIQAQRNALMIVADGQGRIGPHSYAAVQALVPPESRKGWGFKSVVINGGKDKDGKDIWIPTQQHFLAANDTVANDVTKAYQQIGISESAVARLRALQQKYAPFGSIHPKDLHEADAAMHMVAQALIAGGLGNEKPYGEIVRENSGFMQSVARPDKVWFGNMIGVLNQLEAANRAHRTQVDGAVIPGFTIDPRLK